MEYRLEVMREVPGGEQLRPGDIVATLTTEGQTMSEVMDLVRGGTVEPVIVKEKNGKPARSPRKARGS